MSYNDYMYAVDRSSEYLAHYGVLGMRWGVRRAKEHGNRAALEKHYLRASRKLAKLSINANREVSRKRFDQAKGNMLVGGLASAGLGAGLSYGGSSGVPNPARIKTAALAGLASGLTGAAINSEGIMSGRHISDAGHARAVAKRDAWLKEMRNNFKGTEYRKGSPADKAVSKLSKAVSDVEPGGRIQIELRNSRNNGLNRAPNSRLQFTDSNGNPARLNTSNLSAKDQKKVADGLVKLQNRFEGHYQQGLSRGMSHEQAEAYANKQLSRPPKKRTRRR